MSSKNKLELLEKLQSKVTQFHEESKDLSEVLHQIAEKLDDDYILSTDECTEAISKITSVKALRKICESSYREFDRDDLPETFDEFSEEVRSIEALLDKTEYIEAKDFLLRLNIHDKAIAIIFDKLKADLLAIDIDDLSPDECAATLQKYVDLKNLLSCKPAEKAGYMLKIASDFDEAVLSLAFTGEYSVADEAPSDVIEAAAEVITEDIPEAFYDAEAEEETGDSSEIMTADSDETDDECDADADDFIDKDEIELLYSKPLAELLADAGYTMPDHSGIKLERELVKTQANKPFSLKKFKEMIKGNAIGNHLLAFLNYYSINVVLRPENEECFPDEVELLRYGECADFLFRKGYLQKVSAEGYPVLLGVTNKGADIFYNKNACDMLKCFHNKKGALPVMTDDPAIYLALLMRKEAAPDFLRTDKVSEAYYKGSFASVGESEDDTHALFAGCTCTNEADVEKYLKMLAYTTEGITFEEMHFYGLEKGSAEALANIAKKLCNNAYDPEYTEIFIHDLSSGIANPEDKPKELEEPKKEEAKAETQEKAPEKKEKEPEKTGETTKAKPAKKTKETSAPKAKTAKTDSEPKAAPAPKAKPAKQQKAFGDLTEALGYAVDKFITDGKLYCATAYAAAAERTFSEEADGIYSKLAYAANDPAAHCTYTSGNLFSIFTDFNRESEYFYQTASVLRLLFAGQSRNDYNLQQIHDSIKGNPALSDNQALNDLIYTLRNFRTRTGFSADRYADYRSRDRVVLEKQMKTLKAEAASCYENDFEKQKRARSKNINRRYECTWRNIFSKEGDFGVYVKAVSLDDTGYLGLARDFLEGSFIKEEMPVSADNIDPRAVDGFIDTEWDKALEQVALRMKSSDLMGSLRNNLKSHIYKSLAVLCRWIEIHEALGDEKDKGHEAYAAIKDKLISLADSASETAEAQLENAGDSKKAGLMVLIRAIKEVRSKIDGTYSPISQKYFYLDFLRKNYVVLDEDLMPDMESAMSGVAGMSMMDLIEKHAADDEGSLLENLNDYCQDNFGSFCLITDYLRETEAKLPEIVGMLDIAKKNAEGQLEFVQKDFISDIELAQSYGQLDSDENEDRKDSILRLADKWYNWAEQTWNYGFYKSLLEELREQIRKDAHGRGQAILDELESLIEHDRTLERDHADYIGKIRQTILERQNYLVAEDMINNLLSGDIPADTDLFEEDYLADFQARHSYYYKIAGSSGQALSNRVKTNDIKHLSDEDSKGALALKNSWPNPGKKVTPESLKVMLTALGMDIERIAPADASNSMYNVRLRKPLHEDEKSYGHPVYAFGSMGAREGFRVVWLTGSHNADAIIAKMNELGKGRHTIAFLDHSLTETERRRLARKIKEEGSSRIFGVIDRVLYMYLIHNYSRTYIGRMLMETMMPFAYFQPYIYDSVKVMPPEMFMGRKEELEKIKDPAGVNIVYGGRQLGKSALLRKAKNDVEGESELNRAVLIDIKDLDYKAAAKKISQTLYDEKILDEPVRDESDWSELARAVKNKLNGSKKIRYLLLMLDEADRFLESCEEVGYSPFNALKDIQTNVDAGRFKFVVAGLRNVVRFNKAATSGNSVLPHLEALVIKPFTTQEARMLLEEPLYFLGFRFPEGDSDLIPMILATANRFPGLVQLYCAKLIEALKKNNGDLDEASTPPYVIEERLIKRVLAESDFRNQIREKFMITLTIGDDDYYYILALILAYLYRNYDREGGYSAADILRIAKELNTKRISEMTTDQIDALMAELCELNVIRVTAENKYLFSRYNFFTMMGTSDEVDEKLLSFSE